MFFFFFLNFGNFQSQKVYLSECSLPFLFVMQWFVILHWCIYWVKSAKIVFKKFYAPRSWMELNLLYYLVMNWQISLARAGEFRIRHKVLKWVELMKNVIILLLANFGLSSLLLLLIKTLKMKQKISATLLKSANATKTIWHKKSIEIKCTLKQGRESIWLRKLW